MRLNPDCVRSILLAVEDKPFGENIRLNKLVELLPNYDENEINYCALKLAEAGFIDVATVKALRQYSPNIAWINDLTYTGHNFLDNIRSETVWKKAKKKASGLSSIAIDLLAKIASEIVLHELGAQG